MYRILIALALAGALGACGSSGGSKSGDNPLDDGTECVRDNPLEECEVPEEEEETPPEEGIPDELAKNMASFSISDDKSTVTVALTGLDTTPIEATYARLSALDVMAEDGSVAYFAYSVQEDPLDRFFLALGNTSADGSVSALVAGDGGQFTEVQQGAGYSREGTFSPASGQVSYAGYYGAVTNLQTDEGGQLLPVPDTGGPLPDLPGQPAQVTGLIFLNANFADATVNGEIFARVLLDPRDNSETLSLEDLALQLAAIDENGEFLGDVEMIDGAASGDPLDGGSGGSTGSYGGIFGGENAGYVAGVTSVTWSNDTYSSVEEVGVFVLTQCGMAGDYDRICDLVQP
ncbi:hypothetical protein [Salipiger sp.]|uniref:hypothetical protein n=1 Tax=Salipiger sp. TaxID=2078585 RepID=UPI003A969F8F